MNFITALLLPCRSNWDPRHLDQPGFQITKTLAAIAAAGLIFSSAGFGAVYAASAGAPHGWLMASLMVVMAVALEGCKPLAVASAFNAFRRFAVVRGAALALLRSPPSHTR